MFIYEEKETLIHKLHPVTMLAFVGVVFLLSLIFSHPAYLCGLLVVVSGVIISAELFSKWKVYLKLAVPMIIFLMIINAIFVNVGSTVLWIGPRVLVIGKIKITMEALAYGATMGIRLLVITSVFCLYTYAVQPDKALKVFSGWGNKSVLVITLATRLFPLMVSDVKRITEVQRCRGVKFETGKWWQRAKNMLPVISVLLLSCLERSLQIAESMQARGYGSGKRSNYSRDLWRPRDFIILFAVIISLIIGVWAAIKGWSTYSFYPRLVTIEFDEIKMAFVMVAILIFPAFLNWGWKKWPLLKSKI